MPNPLLFADLVLALHAVFVAAVVLMVPLILIGGARGWRWVRVPWLRCLHLAGIGIVTAQAWAGIICPLTTLEMWLRKQGGGAAYSGSFIQYWLHRILYWDAPAWVFAVAYTVFALVVVLTWLLVPPRRRGRRKISEMIS